MVWSHVFSFKFFSLQHSCNEMDDKLIISCSLSPSTVLSADYLSWSPGKHPSYSSSLRLKLSGLILGAIRLFSVCLSLLNWFILFF